MKNGRQRKILEIIRKYNVETQEDLIGRLKEAGYSVTQATVSRDIRALRLAKITDGAGGYKYAESGGENAVNSDRFMTLFSENVASVARGQNIVCVKCLTGMAQAVCAAFDRLSRENIIGTLAGEDTIFVLCRTERDAETLTEEMQKLLMR